MPRAFYARPTVVAALDLLGKVLAHETPEGVAAGKIVEVEAYLETDPASHAFRGKTQRTKILWGKPGFAYVYLNYGMYYCLNIATEKSGVAGCVLIRAIEPVTGLPLMQARRKTTNLLNLTSGPGKVTQALGITVEQYGADMTRGNLVVFGSEENSEIVVTTRIGLSKAEKAPLRFFLKGNRFVSHPNRATRFFEGSLEEVRERLQLELETIR